MEAAKKTSSALFHRSLIRLPAGHQKLLLGASDAKSNIISMASRREPGGRDYEGKLVDEGMIVLRMRIREIKALETTNELPSTWTEWEKQYFLNYNADVCEAMALLQTFFMNVRPIMGLGIMAFVMLSLPIATVTLLFHAAQFAERVVSGMLNLS